MSNSPIQIKFMIDIVGPVSIEPKYWYKVSDLEHPLDSITPEGIDTALNENKIQPIYEGDAVQIMIMNFFLGKKYTDEELQEMVENGIIKEDNPKYQEMFNIVKYAFPVNFINIQFQPYANMVAKISLLGLSIILICIKLLRIMVSQIKYS